MTSIASLALLTSAAFIGVAALLAGFELERQRAKRVLAVALRRPQSVEKAWVSPPDEAGLRRLYVKPVGDARALTVAMDFEVDEVVRRFSLAGIRIGFEHEDVAA
jgi:hypothetical protein